MSLIVPICIEKIENFDFPIWIKFRVLNSVKEVFVIEKLPVISDISIDEKTKFPIYSNIQCKVLLNNPDGTVKIELPSGMESIGGESQIDIKQGLE